MVFKLLKKEKRTVQLYTLILFLGISLLFLMVTMIIQSKEDQSLKAETEINEQGVINGEMMLLENKIASRISDLLYLSDSLRIDRQAMEDEEEIAQQWIAFSDRKEIYDQIRYIAMDGNEVLRVNYAEDGAYAVAPELLQNKGDRYYFTDTVALEKNGVFVSPMDLNVENGVIEQPLKPMMRFATPYYGTSGAVEGIVIINYAVKEMLDQVASIASAGTEELFLLNTDGYWLYNSLDSASEWAFMEEARADVSFAQRYPQEWQRIQTTDSGILATENGVFHYEHLDLATGITTQKGVSLSCKSGLFYIVSYLPGDSWTGSVFFTRLPDLAGRTVMKYLSIYFLISGIAFALASLLAITRAQRREIRFYAAFDAMTGAYNRRYGYEKLSAMQKDLAREQCWTAVCYIDINGLKEVNDHLGHNAGDELIMTVIKTIQESVRAQDFVIRLGGDEFLIVFEYMDLAGAEAIWTRIEQKFNAINAKESREYRISVSHGAASFRCSEKLDMDTMILQADEAMYQKKREMKKTLQVLRKND